ncbi:MAG: ABC transporter permease [Bacteroidetes bacterium]|nr:ABC transporter permease [Bacteroidota bacterium]MCL5027378.1 ABC transporter permease [Chloroflexota bacterium]
MRNTLAILQKEIWYFAVTPGSYVTAAAFLVLTGAVFAQLLMRTQADSVPIYPLFVGLYGIVSAFLGVVFGPIISMRMLSEEARSGTIEQLLTMPIRDIEVVIGKFLAAFVFMGAMVTMTLFYPLAIQLFGNPDWGPILGTYIGMLLVGAASLSIGLLTSSFTQNQIVAAVISLVALLFLWLLDALATLFAPPLFNLVAFMSAASHMSEFTKGVIDSRDVIYYLSVVAIALFLTTRSLEARRWR